jgi:hypothetical protein
MTDSTVITARAALGDEWVTLQKNYEQYENTALHIKLVAIAMCAIGWQVEALLIAMAMILFLWAEEAIFKTFQSRLGVRLLRIEALLRQSDVAATPFQLHTEWLANRKGLAGLLMEYARSMFKPTVAFPYILLLVLLVAKGNAFFGGSAAHP